MEFINERSYFLMDSILEKVNYEWDFEKGVEIDHDNNIVKKLKSSLDNAGDKKKWYERLLSKIRGFNPKIKYGILAIIIPLMLSYIPREDVKEISKKDTVSKQIYSAGYSGVEKDTTKYITQDLKKEAEKYDATKMNISQEGIDFIKNEEKLRLTAYDIGDGGTTIGYGHFSPKGKSKYKVGDKISEKKAERLLKKDLKTAVNGVRRLFKFWKKQGIDRKITQKQFDTLVSMMYNMGVSAVRSSDFILLVKAGKMEEASEKIKTTGISNKFPGLAKRRKAESDMFKSV